MATPAVTARYIKDRCTCYPWTRKLEYRTDDSGNKGIYCAHCNVRLGGYTHTPEKPTAPRDPNGTDSGSRNGTNPSAPSTHPR